MDRFNNIGMDVNMCNVDWFDDSFSYFKPLPPHLQRQEPIQQKELQVEPEKEEEMDIDEPRQETEMEKCFRITITRQKILACLSIADLKQMGRVCKSWRRIASAELIRRDCFRIELEFDSSFKEDFVVLRKGDRYHLNEDTVFSIDLTRFNETVLMNSIAFPCSDFSFTGGDFNSPSLSMQNFLNIYGSNVFTLLLHQVKYSTDVLYKILSEKIPNLKKLSLSWPKTTTTTTTKASSSSSSSGFSDNNNNNLHLPSLKLLHFDESMNKTEESRKLALDLMNSAPNLKIIGNFPLSMVNEVYPPLSNIKIMREIHVHAENEMELKSLTRFIEAKTQLLILNVSSPRKHTMDENSTGELAQILENSKDTLEILRWTHSGLLPENIIFHRVKELALKIGKNPVENFIGEIILDRFPKLTSLCLKFPYIFYECDPIFENYFIVHPGFFNPFNNFNNNNNNEVNAQLTFPHITHMEITGEFPSQWWPKLRDIFPAIKTFNTRDCPSGRNLMGVAFKLWTELRTLEFAFNSVVYNDGKYYREKDPERIQVQPEPDLFSILQ